MSYLSGKTLFSYIFLAARLWMPFNHVSSCISPLWRVCQCDDVCRSPWYPHATRIRSNDDLSDDRRHSEDFLCGLFSPILASLVCVIGSPVGSPGPNKMQCPPPPEQNSAKTYHMFVHCCVVCRRRRRRHLALTNASQQSCIPNIFLRTEWSFFFSFFRSLTLGSGHMCTMHMDCVVIRRMFSHSFFGTFLLMIFIICSVRTEWLYVSARCWLSSPPFIARSPNRLKRLMVWRLHTFVQGGVRFCERFNFGNIENNAVVSAISLSFVSSCFVSDAIDFRHFRFGHHVLQRRTVY